MASRFRKRRSLALAGLLLLLLTAGAVAYFTTTGSGTGSATVGSNSTLTLHPTLSGGNLYPGTTNTVSFTVDNPSPGHQLLNTIHLASIKACTGAGSSWNGSSCSNSGTEQTTCESVETGASDTTTANFWMPDVTVNKDYGNGNGQSVSQTGTLTMNDLNSSQNACQGANLTLNFTSN
jgi:hypothetical protein